jgi:hypothetical protein
MRGLFTCALVLALAGGCATGTSRVPAAQPAPDTSWMRVIVQLRLPRFETEEQKLALILRTREALLVELGSRPYRVTRAYETIPAVGLEVSPDALRVLEKSALVEGIGKDTLSRPQ